MTEMLLAFPAAGGLVTFAATMATARLGRALGLDERGPGYSAPRTRGAEAN